MVDSDLLKGKIRSIGDTIEDFAKKIGRNKTTLCQKINNKASFTHNEILTIKDKLDLTQTEILSIFFTK